MLSTRLNLVVHGIKHPLGRADSVVHSQWADLYKFLTPIWNIRFCPHPSHAGRLVQNKAVNSIHAVLIAQGDLGDKRFLQLIAQYRRAVGSADTLVIFNHFSQELCQKALRLGVVKCWVNPVENDELRFYFNKLSSYGELRNAEISSKSQLTPWIGKSDASREILRQLAQTRNESRPILLEGESGTGKEVAARLIHRIEGARPFIAVNVATLPESVFESEFFGHVKGAFTGADVTKIGLAEAADGGDLFLDEIETLSLSAQAKLLRFLESGELRKVGSRESVSVNVRIIAATNQNLEELVWEKKFREDFLWRLNGQKIFLPPLRERMEDLPDLIDYFLSKERPFRNIQLTPEGLDIMNQYYWPGNVRELRRVVESACLESQSPYIGKKEVNQVLPRYHRSIRLEGVLGQKPSNQIASDLVQINSKVGLNDALSLIERDLISRTLKTTCEIDSAAQLLKVSRSTLYKKIREHGIQQG